MIADGSRTVLTQTNVAETPAPGDEEEKACREQQHCRSRNVFFSCSNTWALTKPTSWAGRQRIGRDSPPRTPRCFAPSPSLVQGLSPLKLSVAWLRGCWFSPGTRRPLPSAYDASWKVYRMLVLSRSVTTPCWGGLTWSQTMPTK